MSQEDAFEGYQLSSWGKRVGAYLIDVILLALISFFVVSVIGGLIFFLRTIIVNLGEGLNEGGSEPFISYLLRSIMLTLPFGVGPVVGLFYYGLAMRRGGEKNGQSLGKDMLGIRVVREDGQAVSFWWAGWRQVVVIGILFMNILLFLTVLIAPTLNFLWPLWDSKRQALHDKIVRSRVVISK